jgi:hypothetical protein
MIHFLLDPLEFTNRPAIRRNTGRYLKCLDKFQEGVPNQKTRKKVHINTCPQTSIMRVTALTFARPQSFRVLLVSKLKPLVHSAPIENEKTLNQRIVLRVKTFVTAPGNLYYTISSANLHITL